MSRLIFSTVSFRRQPFLWRQLAALRIRQSRFVFFPRLTCNRLVAYTPAQVDEVFKALADPSRRKLLDELHKTNGQTLSELCEHLDMTRQAVTKHLALLEAASLVVTIWRGREKLHYLNPVPIHQICDRWINKFERHRPRFRAIRQRAR
jgi:DNA-binding transcriptional ArsR family regulator